MSEDFILKTNELVKEFKGFVAVNGVNLGVRRGHIHALIGPNGAGKTTVFNLLTKFLIPTSGHIVFNGKDITAQIPACAAETAQRGNKSTLKSRLCSLDALEGQVMGLLGSAATLEEACKM